VIEDVLYSKTYSAAAAAALSQYKSISPESLRKIIKNKVNAQR
jgi:hypothetical protein